MIDNMKINVDRSSMSGNYFEFTVTINIDGQQYQRKELVDMLYVDMQGYFDYTWRRLGEMIKEDIIKLKLREE